MLSKILIAAQREYKSTALTKAFLFGVVIFPLVIFVGISIAGATGMFKSVKKPLEGTIAVADATPDRVVLAGLRKHFDAARQQAEAAKSREEMKRIAKSEIPKHMTPEMAAQVTDERLEQGLDMADSMFGPGKMAKVSVEALPGDAELAKQEQRVLSGDLLALVTIGAGALDPASGAWELCKGKRMDPDHLDLIRDAVKSAIVDWRYRQKGLDPADIKRLSDFPEAKTTTITESGKTKSFEGFAVILPMVFMMLLWVSVMTGGQYLLTSTIEEKSSRVMEVLLSAISPMQLLTGKIIGQGLVGLTVLAIYVALGMAGVQKFGMLSLVPTDKLAWLGLYFVMAYFLFASLMAAVGSAVTEVREAQSLMGPIMMLLIFPLILWMPISRNPNSLLAQVLSFIPPCTPFVMILRVSQTIDPVPTWQVVAATTVGFLGVFAVMWAAVKIFRVGVLMYGKPPSLVGLVKMLRYA